MPEEQYVCVLCKEDVDTTQDAGVDWFSVGDTYFHMGCD